MKAKTLRIITSRWAGIGLVIVAAGFLCDGVTEIGHHAFLILGGIAVGWGAATEGRRVMDNEETQFNIDAAAEPSAPSCTVRLET